MLPCCEPRAAQRRQSGPQAGGRGRSRPLSGDSRRCRRRPPGHCEALSWRPPRLLQPWQGRGVGAVTGLLGRLAGALTTAVERALTANRVTGREAPRAARKHRMAPPATACQRLLGQAAARGPAVSRCAAGRRPLLRMAKRPEPDRMSGDHSGGLGGTGLEGQRVLPLRARLPCQLAPVPRPSAPHHGGSKCNQQRPVASESAPGRAFVQHPHHPRWHPQATQSAQHQQPACTLVLSIAPGGPPMAAAPALCLDRTGPPRPSLGAWQRGHQPRARPGGAVLTMPCSGARGTLSAEPQNNPAPAPALAPPPKHRLPGAASRCGFAWQGRRHAAEPCPRPALAAGPIARWGARQHAGPRLVPAARHGPAVWQLAAPLGRARSWWRACGRCCGRQRRDCSPPSDSRAGGRGRPGRRLEELARWQSSTGRDGRRWRKRKSLRRASGRSGKRQRRRWCTLAGSPRQPAPGRPRWSLGRVEPPQAAAAAAAVATVEAVARAAERSAVRTRLCARLRPRLAGRWSGPRQQMVPPSDRRLPPLQLPPRPGQPLSVAGEAKG